MNQLDQYVQLKIWEYVKYNVMIQVKTILEPLKNLNDVYYTTDINV